jgi:hypothetical protein
MRFIRSLALIAVVLFMFQSSLGAQTFGEDSENKTVSPKFSERPLPKWMREAKPMPMPSIPEGGRRSYRRPKTTAITPKSDETYWTPKRMREAKPMPMPSIPEGYRHPGESMPGPRQIPGHTDAHEPTPPVIPNVPN